MSTNGRYTALAKVADGGMAEIFLAVQRGARGFERKVILKRVRAEVAQDSELLKALHDEARIAMGLAHSNIVQVLDVGEAQGRTFLVLELVDGWSLSQLIKRATALKDPVPWPMSLFIAAQLCRALAHAHSFQRDGKPFKIVHRDLSPQNVLVSAEGEVKLTDFGIAHAEIREVQTKIGLVKGKPAYMSPEQARGEALDARSDLYALGVMLYELCTGVRPFKGANDYEVLLKVQAGKFEAPSKAAPTLPRKVAGIISRAMEKNRDDRYQSADELLAELERALRASFGGVGQTELKAWLTSLTERDGQKRISERVLAPLPEPGSAEFISDVELLSASSIEVPLDSEVLKPPPPPPPEARAVRRWPLTVAALMAALGGVAWFAFLRAPTETPAPVELRSRATAQAEAPVVVPPSVADPAPERDAAVLEPAAIAQVSEDAGEEMVAVDAGAAESVAVVAPPEPEPEVPVAAASDAGSVAAPEVVAAVTQPAAVPAPMTVPRRAAPSPATVISTPVKFVSVPPGAAVRVERTPFGVTPISWGFNTGVTFAVTFSLPGYEDLTRKFIAQPGQVISVHLVKKPR